MTAITHDLRMAAATAKAAAPAQPAKKGFWARLFDAFVEARMRQVEREILAYRHLVPESALNEIRVRGALRDAKDRPPVK
jgi:hypothetical protein